MDEIEKIISQKWLPKDFFEEETICGFRVSRHRKEIWAVNLELLKEFARVCDEHQLKWYAAFGTLLGAMRHNGFIPWDDDLDVAMLRDDYDKFKELASEFTEPFLLQTPETEPEYSYSFIKLRNSNTWVKQPKIAHRKYCHGISLDIFPLDNIDEADYLEQWEKMHETVMAMSAYLKHGSECLTDADRRQITQYYRNGITPTQLFAESEAIAKLHSGYATDFVAPIVFLVYAPEKVKYPTEAWTGDMTVDFYGINLRIPSGWEKILKTTYGKWQEFPPEHLRGNWHEAEFAPRTPCPWHSKNSSSIIE